MATAKERMAGTRRRRRRREIQIVVTIHEDDLTVIAREGHPGAASTDTEAREQAVSTFVSDCVVALR